MNPGQIKWGEDMLCCQATSECAEPVAARYKGTCCMGTAIHASVPQQDSLHDSFYYDLEWMLKWHKATPHQKALLCRCKVLLFPG